MALTKYKLGELIERLYNKNSEGEYGVDDVRGVSNLKAMMKTKADLTGRDLTKFSVVYPNEFVFNHRTSRNGSRFSITQNYDDVPHIFTEDYVVFRVRKDCESKIDHNWLYLYFNRDEFDRFVITNSWGSSTEFYNWEDICDIDIELPDLPTQQKFVNVYKAMIANQKSYEKGLSDLKLTCDAYIEDLRRRIPCEKIGSYIEESTKKNTDYAISYVQGVNSNSVFSDSIANLTNVNLSNYKVVHSDDFAYNPSRINVGSIAHRERDDCDCIISPMYIVFRVTSEELLSDYLMLWLQRTEFFRSTLFYAIGSVRDTFDFKLMKEVMIPIPDIRVQQAIVDIYKCYQKCKEINERLKTQIKDICPILIRGSIEEALREA